jgi:hypothetical protein
LELKTIRSKKEALISACGRNEGFEVIESSLGAIEELGKQKFFP